MQRNGQGQVESEADKTMEFQSREASWKRGGPGLSRWVGRYG